MRKILLSLAVLALIVLAAGCNAPAPAATVNGKTIPMTAYLRQVELASNYLKQQGVDDKTPEGQQIIAQMKSEILDQMIDQEIINQAAAKENLTVTKEELDKELADIVTQMGGQAALDEWIKTSTYTKDEVDQAVRDQLLTGKLIAKVSASVPTTGEQVHARHILVETKEQADAITARLKKGEDFAKLAQELSMDTGSKDEGGDLGWFPKGYMIPAFEDTAFALQAGKYSDVVQTEYGFHIILMVERDANRALPSEMLHVNQQEAFTTWLEAQKATAKIEKPATTPTK